jgi:hypothetical protein
MAGSGVKNMKVFFSSTDVKFTEMRSAEVFSQICRREE